ncbi:glycerol-3-phosphate acyltransferase 1 [Hordeum vulgare subsp. vulgare]|uniref:Phospholipid/glycerol acyltransferase domain-containing protein n=1 Tax=Hordeum vulgare subsp. vulgare TaxID=112509 RepID=A0A8I6X6H4_HORVV|nr:glycerol-3-phosphate acyltransferase 1 [Hordeum vulgare subsp. vulgare]
MVFPAILPKIAVHWLINLYRAARKLRSNAFQYYRNSTTNTKPSTQAVSSSERAMPSAADGTVVCDFHGGLLRSAGIFPYFMLVAFEGGSLLRALVLLCFFPLVCMLGEHSDAGVRVMTFVTFVGLRPRDADLVARTILPKFYMEGLHAQVYDHLWLPAKRKVALTSAPRVMAEWFLKEYMAANVVVGCELEMVEVGRVWYFTGLLCGTGPDNMGLRHKALREALEADGNMADVAVVGSSDHLCAPYCKELYVVSLASGKTARLPRERYPKPLIFHDGRLVFLPTAPAMLAFFLFLPLGFILSVIRISIGIVLPYNISFAASALAGVCFRTSGRRTREAGGKRRGVLFVCTHRTLVDPIMLTAALQRAVPAVTYSLSRLSEMIAPIKTVRLTRDRDQDAAMMSRLLEQGDLAVCPEGTTCREPYLLRFSPLFAELADDMEPVALDAQVTSLYGTTASGHKWLDPVAFFANPVPAYRVEFLGAVPREQTRAGGRTGAEVANWVQRRLGEALGFECTELSRRDKYIMLAGNDGVVRNRK